MKIIKLAVPIGITIAVGLMVASCAPSPRHHNRYSRPFPAIRR